MTTLNTSTLSASPRGKPTATNSYHMNKVPTMLKQLALAVVGLLIMTALMGTLTLLAIDAYELERTGRCVDCILLPHVRPGL